MNPFGFVLHAIQFDSRKVFVQDQGLEKTDIVFGQKVMSRPNRGFPDIDYLRIILFHGNSYVHRGSSRIQCQD